MQATQATSLTACKGAGEPELFVLRTAKEKQDFPAQADLRLTATCPPRLAGRQKRKDMIRMASFCNPDEIGDEGSDHQGCLFSCPPPEVHTLPTRSRA